MRKRKRKHCFLLNERGDNVQLAAFIEQFALRFSRDLQSDSLRQLNEVTYVFLTEVPMTLYRHVVPHGPTLCASLYTHKQSIRYE